MAWHPLRSLFVATRLSWVAAKCPTLLVAGYVKSAHPNVCLAVGSASDFLLCAFCCCLPRFLACGLASTPHRQSVMRLVTPGAVKPNCFYGCTCSLFNEFVLQMVLSWFALNVPHPCYLADIQTAVVYTQPAPAPPAAEPAPDMLWVQLQGTSH